MPDLLTLACNECGAPLEVPTSTNFLACSHCGAQLQVKRSGSACYTARLDEVAQRTERLEEDVEFLRLRQELEDLERGRVRARSRRSTTTLGPTVLTLPMMIGTLLAAVFGVAWTIISIQLDAPFFFPLFGIFFVFLAVFIGGWTRYAAAKVGRATDDHERRRQEILDRLQARESR